jgi:hypothetical protein
MPEDRMNARFPQKARVGGLVGMPVHDAGDRILGDVTDVPCKPDGRIVLVMPEGRWFWRSGPAGAAPHRESGDPGPSNQPKLRAWDPAQGSPVDQNDTIRIATFPGHRPQSRLTRTHSDEGKERSNCAAREDAQVITLMKEQLLIARSFAPVLMSCAPRSRWSADPKAAETRTRSRFLR